jgi:hypothetical protein
LFVKDIQRVLFFGLGISVVFRSFSEKIILGLCDWWRLAVREGNN